MHISNMKMDEREKKSELQKSHFNVLGLCCPAEVPLIERILKPLQGVHKVCVNVPSKSVMVLHDPISITQVQIVAALNSARLDASIREIGEAINPKKWPSRFTLVSGFLLILSFTKFWFEPMHWLALGAVAVGIPPIFMKSFVTLRRWILDINTLVIIAVAGTIALGDYIEAGFIVVLFTSAEWIESLTSYKAHAAMQSLMSMAPQKAVLAQSGATVDTKDVKLNTLLAVKAGDMIPIDGIVVEGRSEVDEKTLTGEPYPVTKDPQSQVWAGTLNLNGYMSIKTVALAEDSAVARMAKLVEEAQQNTSKTQRIVEVFAKYYTPVILVLAVGLAIIPLSLRSENWHHYLYLSLVVLMCACPCALVLSTPIVMACALSRMSSIGVLVKGGDYLEKLAKIKIMAFDKTGTITRGKFSVSEMISLSKDEEDVGLDKMLYWVTSLESKSSHPMAAALVDYCRSKGIEPATEKVKDFQNFPGEGISGIIDGKCIFIGNQKMSSRAGCKSVPDITSEHKGGGTVGYVLIGEKVVGYFTLSDDVRFGALGVIRELKNMGIKVAMLTGDTNAAALRVNNKLEKAIGIMHAELLPDEKAKLIVDLKKSEGQIAMIGDGINDAPALASSDVGIAMGATGSAIASETSHITLMSDDLKRLPDIVKISRKTCQKIMENVFLSMITKLGVVALALSGHPLIWAAMLADVGTCLVVIFNSTLLLGKWGLVGMARATHRHKCCAQKEGSCQERHSMCEGKAACSQDLKHGACEDKGSCGEILKHGTCGERGPCCQSSTGVGNTHVHDHEVGVGNSHVHDHEVGVGNSHVHDHEVGVGNSHVHNHEVGVGYSHVHNHEVGHIDTCEKRCGTHADTCIDSSDTRVESDDRSHEGNQVNTCQDHVPRTCGSHRVKKGDTCPNLVSRSCGFHGGDAGDTFRSHETRAQRSSSSHACAENCIPARTNFDKCLHGSCEESNEHVGNSHTCATNAYREGDYKHVYGDTTRVEIVGIHICMRHGGCCGRDIEEIRVSLPEIVIE
ncbi:putative inactive cadmium/zinc-transporting ATPase HMA3 isoform X1 [Amborella trichopoda]|nr:putative inactive cadmium/zinc-transporting ATPase HMA3 isoform X1 [Amborella trichopoda]|eukprot:XP_020527133.1 putative inactive cadmium/zinc-transporting ATPase HMA3 isoform X1 [Amborella trichopoda]